jgi:peptide/nickel transport system permease protein
MRQFILRRVLYSLVTLLILSLTIFVVVRLTGDPALLMAEPGARPEDLARVRAQWGLDRSWSVQYLSFLKNIVQGQLGMSFNYRMPVSELYFERLPNSLQLALAATMVSLLLGIPAGAGGTMWAKLSPSWAWPFPISGSGWCLSWCSPSGSAGSLPPVKATGSTS